jgi:hypothetical protein
MHRPAFFPRRLIGAAVIASAAGMIPVAALAATSFPAAGRAATPPCRTSGLVIWLTPQYGGGYAGADGTGKVYRLNGTSGPGCEASATADSASPRRHWPAGPSASGLQRQCAALNATTSVGLCGCNIGS